MVYAGNGMQGVSAGCPVYARDGDLLGHVKELRATVFKVDAPLRPDYWLRWDSVAAANSAGVTLNVDKDELSRAYATDPAISEDMPPAMPAAATRPADYVPADNPAPPDHLPAPPAP